MNKKLLAIERSFQLQINIKIIVVNINSKDTNWEINRIHPKIEYLLRPEKAHNIIKTIAKPANRITTINERLTSTKKKGDNIM